MNIGVILMVCGGVSLGIGLIMAIFEAILAPKRRIDIRKKMQEKY